MVKKKKFAVVSCCLDDWGGSEELWARSISVLLEHGISDITVYKQRINPLYHEFVDLKAKKVKLKSITPEVSLLKQIFSKFTDLAEKLSGKLGISTYQWNKPAKNLHIFLKNDRPDLVLISQGINFDGLLFAYQCLKLNIPYVIVCHKAVNFYWPEGSDREFMRRTLISAKMCYFVSEHNKRLTEEQFGIRLTNGKIVINPIKTELNPLPYPENSTVIKLACVGRLFVIDKGQDILIRVLAQKKWKDRNIHVSFIGKGPDSESLMEMASLLSVKNISFPGFSGDIKEIWRDHHALILPSRSEGLPLTIIEAMALGRICIVTNAGGNAEIVNHQVTGFVGEATEYGVDEALESAWEERLRWREMGLNAAEHIKKTIPQYPEKIFADFLLSTINDV